MYRVVSPRPEPVSNSESKPMAKEIERKFLVSGQRWRTFANEGVAIRQAYIVAQDDRSLRVRIYGDGRARLTIKVGHAALVRDEYEVAIDRHEAEDMLRLAAAKPGATIAVRQNLALVVGLQGRFDEAERLVRQDLPPEAVANNMAWLRAAASTGASGARSWEGLRTAQ